MIEGLRKSAAFQAFMEKILEKKNEWEGVLKNSGDPNQMFRAQGVLTALDYVIDLPELMIQEALQEKKEEKEKEKAGGDDDEY